MSDEPTVVTDEQLDVFHNLIQYYAADARYTSLDEVRSGCLYKIDAIKAVLDERERSKLDFERWHARIRSLTEANSELKAIIARLRPDVWQAAVDLAASASANDTKGKT